VKTTIKNIRGIAQGVAATRIKPETPPPIDNHPGKSKSILSASISILTTLVIQ
jgi:hypothetical protein